AEAGIKVRAEISFDLVHKDVHQTDDHAGHGGPQGVADEKSLVERALHIDGVDDSFHHLPSVIDPGPDHVFGFECPLAVAPRLLFRLHILFRPVIAVPEATQTSVWYASPRRRRFLSRTRHGSPAAASTVVGFRSPSGVVLPA